MKDPYVYADSNVLKNKLGIKNEDILEKAESDFVGLAASKLRNSDFQIANIQDALKIHEVLFSSVYDWAGKIRTINIYKSELILEGCSVDYVFSTYINQALDELNDEFVSVDWGSLNNQDKIKWISYFVSEFWHIHPFREGNTRTSAMFLYFLIKKANLHINIDFLSKNGKYFRNALVLSCIYSQSKTEYLTGIIKDSVTARNNSTQKYETLEGVEVNKYSYTNHTVKKIKTISKPSSFCNK